MGGFSMVHWLVFGIVAVLLFGRDIHDGLWESLLRYQDRGTSMRKYWNKFLWSAQFWALLGAVGLVSWSPTAERIGAAVAFATASRSV